MKKKLLYGLLALALLFGFIQFFRPEKNWQINPSRNDIFYKKQADPRIVTLLKTSCYDCHSNNTAYPWYNNIAPLSWMIANHIKEGKNELNFANWDLYIPEKKHELLDKISEVIEEYEMPLGSYLIFHSEARLSDADKELLKIWAADQVVALESIEK
ncbi:MAG: heme-binding domain-containing protein [Bacteroidales bacterium]